jgi:hypothetical protein
MQAPTCEQCRPMQAAVAHCHAEQGAHLGVSLWRSVFTSRMSMYSGVEGFLEGFMGGWHGSAAFGGRP